MRAGPLRHRLVLEEPVDTEDPMGGVVTDWGHVATVWASIEPVTGREFGGRAQVLAEADALIRIRWSPRVAAVTPAWRATHAGVVYNIARVIHVRLGQQMIELLAKTGTNEG